MSSEEKFKDILKQKLEAKEFAFNAENWEKAQGMIDAERNRKKRIIPFILLCVGIFISGGICFYFINHMVFSPDVKPELKAIDEKHAPSATKQSEIKSELKLQALKDKLKSKQAQISEQKPEQSLNKTIIPFRKNKPDPEASAAVKKFQRVQSQEQMNENKVMEMAVAMKKVKTNTDISTKSTDQSGNNFVGQEVSLNKKTTNPKEEVPEPKIEKPHAEEKQAMVVDSEHAAVITENFSTSIKPQAESPDASTNLPIAAQFTEAAAAPAVSETVGLVSDAEVPTSNDSLIPKEKRDPKNIFSVEAGLNYHVGWENTGKTDANAINPVFGINYLRVIADKFDLSVGAHYTSVGNLSNYSHASKDTYYSFGETSEMTVITPVKIHYLHIPVKLHYNLDRKQVIGIGYTFGYLLTVNNKVENYTQRLNATSEPVVTKTKGYAQGFNGFDSQCTLFYRRQLRSGLSAHAELFYGFTDIKDNTFFESNYFERNMGIKFTMIYNIFKR